MGIIIFHYLVHINSNLIYFIPQIYYKGVNGNAKKFAEEMIASGVVDDIRAEEW